jgi:hypothetical protein
MFERRVCHFDDHFVRSKPVRLDDDRLSVALGCIEHRSKLLERDFLVPEINRRSRTAGDADDLLIDLRAEREARERHRNRNPVLQNKMRAEDEEENHQECNVEQRKHDEPREVIFLRPAKLHARAELDTNDPELTTNEHESTRIRETSCIRVHLCLFVVKDLAARLVRAPPPRPGVGN